VRRYAAGARTRRVTAATAGPARRGAVRPATVAAKDSMVAVYVSGKSALFRERDKTNACAHAPNAHPGRRPDMSQRETALVWRTMRPSHDVRGRHSRMCTFGRAMASEESE